jgi:hypothetical protein
MHCCCLCWNVVAGVLVSLCDEFGHFISSAVPWFADVEVLCKVNWDFTVSYLWISICYSFSDVFDLGLFGNLVLE